VELIPCPRCMQAAEYIPASPGHLARSTCLSGEHEHSLSPDVEKTLREIARRAAERLNRHT